MKRVEDVLLSKLASVAKQQTNRYLQRLNHNIPQPALSTNRNIRDIISLSSSALQRNIPKHSSVVNQGSTFPKLGSSLRNVKDKVEINHSSSNLSNTMPSTTNHTEFLTILYTSQARYVNTNSSISHKLLLPKNDVVSHNLFGTAKNQVKFNNTISRPFSIKINSMRNITAPRIHYGGDFEDTVTKSTIFVDKSLFIHEILNDPSEVILITMPRRWGKSLNLDMLKRFLEIKVDESGNPLKDKDRINELNYKLFFGGIAEIGGIFGAIDLKKLDIAQADQEKYSNIQGQYPVIFIDFKDCKGSSVEEVKSNLSKKITDTIENFGYLSVSKKIYRGITTIGQKYNEILNRTKSGNFKEAIKDLSSLLHSYHNKKVWILIDEYDAVANKAYLEFSNKDAKAVSELFRSMFESTLKGNSSLEKGVITGVQYIVKSGMLSGLNNLSKHNVTSTKYSKYYGIDKGEMEHLLNHFNINEQSRLKIKDWYNGYKSNKGSAETPNFIDKYNIWSVVNYLNNQSEGFKSYWENSSLGTVINKKIFKNSTIKNIVEGLINNNNLVLGTLISDFSVNDFETLKDIVNNHDVIGIKQDGIDLLFSYLFITGYLTNTFTTNEYALPNKEIRTEFETKLKDYYNQIFNIAPSQFNELTRDLNSIFLAEDNKEIVNILTKSFAPKLGALIKGLQVYSNNSENLTTKGVFGNEDLMHSLLNNIAIQVVNAKFSTERYTTKPNGTKGRSDIVLSKNNKGILIEMKYNKKADEALAQAKDYDHLVKNTTTKIFIGCNINDKQEISLCGEVVMNGKTLQFTYNS